MRVKRLQVRARPVCAFSLLELLVSMTVLIVIVGFTLSAINQINNLWMGSRSRLTSFQDARAGFEFLTRQISQATLNTYWDYDSRTATKKYVRASELHFLMADAAALLNSPECTTQAIFFQAPMGYTERRGQAVGVENYTPLTAMLCATGFYVKYGPRPNLPGFLQQKTKSRSRLYRFLQPGERLAVYDSGGGSAWSTNELPKYSAPIAENVIGLILRARYTTGTGDHVDYDYDSRNAVSPATHHQLPPVISVTMVVIDEDSANRLGSRYQETAPPVPFDDQSEYEDSLKAWKDHLDGMVPKVNYRVFTMDIPIRGAKWSSD